MDKSEKVVADYLAHRGYTDVVYEPDGNVPPDFLVDGRIAVEVRRLNQNYEAGGKTSGLEEVAIPLWLRFRRLALSLGPPIHGVSWFVFFRFRRPLEDWKKLKPKLRQALQGFVKSSVHTKRSLRLGNGFEIEIVRASSPHGTFFVMAGYSDHESGGSVLAEIERNLRICIDEKTRKTAYVRGRYSEWWLVVTDHIGLGLDEFDRTQFRERVRLNHTWDKVILVDPTNHTRAFEI
jgi:hypothetical protein